MQIRTATSLPYKDLSSTPLSTLSRYWHDLYFWHPFISCHRSCCSGLCSCARLLGGDVWLHRVNCSVVYAQSTEHDMNDCFLFYVTILLQIFFCHGATVQVGQGLLTIEDSLSHSGRHTTLGSTPLDGWSARRRDLYLTTHNTHKWETSISPGGIRTHNRSTRAAADPHLRSRGNWDWPKCFRMNYKDTNLTLNVSIYIK